jgi:hypothetical protein
MKIIGILLLIGGLVTGAVGIWRKKNPGGPHIVGNVSDSTRDRIARDIYGVKQPGNQPIIVGVVLIIVGFILIVLA